MSERGPPDGSKLDELCRIIADLGREVGGAGAPGPGDDPLGAALDAARALADELRARRADARSVEGRLADLVEVVGALVGFDYGRRAIVTERGDVYDGFAYSLNMMAEELESTTVSKDYVNGILQSMRDPLVVASPAGAMTTVNRAACELAERGEDELRGRPLEALFPQVSAPDLVGRGGVAGVETVCRRGGEGSEPAPVLFSASLMADKHGDPSGIVCVARDLTELKKMEQERWSLREAMHRQAVILEELSTPLIPISHDVLVMPLIGTVDPRRAGLMTQVLLDGIESRRARVAILDITGVRKVDEAAVHGLSRAVRGARLLGAEVLLTGIHPSIAVVLTQFDLGRERLATFGTLRDAIAYAARGAPRRRAARDRA